MRHQADFRAALPRAGVPKALLFLLIAILILTAWAGNPARANPRYAGLVIDAVSGEVFYEDGADALRYPASLTKMMTLYMAFQALDAGRLRLDQQIGISRHADSQPPSHLGLPAGASISVEQAIYALVTKSANDIAAALGEAIGRTEWRFARLMTEQARRLGMTRTTFRNASGLPNSGQRSTARDMARLGQALLRDFPHYYEYFATRHWQYRGTTYRNHNGLLGNYAGVDGIKTGYIRASGFNLVASARRGRLRLIAVVFGGRTSSSRNAHVADLLDRAFDSARGQYLIAHGSMPFEPPIPARHPGTRIAPSVQLAGLSDAISVITVPPQPPGRAGQTGRSGDPAPRTAPAGTAALPARVGRAVPDSLADIPMPPRPSARLRPTLALLAERVASAPVTREAGGDFPAGDNAGWAIQLGAYVDPMVGDAALTRAAGLVPGLLGQAPHRIIAVEDANRGPLFRARFTGLSYETADAACTQLIAAGQSCLAIAPSR
ncbi:MAG: D-alanyl-D-alanine carboxypeptidase [Alphaproteobacteria bacterium]|jgi:D-alanyl-D-alanine carboxypeptidase|nr:D-alanyl-D-alanine carboxypeptidase [Alphaproteobacteria bacterium]